MTINPVEKDQPSLIVEFEKIMDNINHIELSEIFQRAQENITLKTSHLILVLGVSGSFKKRIFFYLIQEAFNNILSQLNMKGKKKNEINLQLL